jgi:HD domain
MAKEDQCPNNLYPSYSTKSCLKPNIKTVTRQTGCCSQECETMTYYAHSKNAFGVRHRLADNLDAVSRLAEGFAKATCFREEARLAGLLHDLGKYGDRFQARLRGEEQGLNHWSQGAWLALTEHKAIVAALAIQGHHIGLQHFNCPVYNGFC